MLKFIEVTGKTKEEAIARGLAQLGLDQDDVSVEILDLGKTALPCTASKAREHQNARHQQGQRFHNLLHFHDHPFQTVPSSFSD